MHQMGVSLHYRAMSIGVFRLYAARGCAHDQLRSCVKRPSGKDEGLVGKGR